MAIKTERESQLVNPGRSVAVVLVLSMELHSRFPKLQIPKAVTTATLI